MERSGAIRWVARSTEQGMALLAKCQARSNYALYLPALLLAFVAYIPVWRRLKAVVERPLPLLLMSSSLLATVAFCWVVADWGRFFYIHLVLWFLLALLPSAPLPDFWKGWKLALLALVAVMYGNYWKIWHFAPTSLLPPESRWHSNLPALVQPFFEREIILKAKPDQAPH